MKILVTGSSGNLGEHILKNSSFEFIPFGRKEYLDLENSIPSTLDYIIHCAYDLKSSIEEDPDKIIESNILSTMKLLKAAKSKKIKKFIFLSSGSVYGQSSDSSESSTTNPLTINGITKKLNEKIIRTYCLKNNIPFLILRVFNSFGGNDQFSVISKMIKCFQENKEFTLYNEGIAERDYIHINDIAKIVCFFISNDSEEDTINIGTGKTTKIIEILNKIESKNCKIKVKRETLENEVEYSRANISRLRKYYKGDFIDILDFIDDLEL